MANFSYVARTSSGERVTGTLAAANLSGVLAELQARRLAPVQVEPLRERQRRHRVSTRKMANLYQQAADLLRAGVPLLRTLRILGQSKSNPALATVVDSVADEVADGARLAGAMAAHPDVFPSVHVAMVRAGERGAFLEPVLARLGSFLEHQADLRAKVIGNLLYPTMLLVLSLLVIVCFLIFFVPKFEPLYARIQLPLPTKILLAASAMFTRYWLLTAAAVVAAVIGLQWLRRHSAMRRRMALWQLRIPGLGPITRSLAVARFARMLGTLLANGVPLLGAMQIARDAAGHVLLEEAIDTATESVRAGESLAQPLAASGLFEADVIEMIAVGEVANNLAEVLITSVADTIEKRIDRSLTTFVRFMEPLMLLLIAGVVVFMYVALILPMLRMSSALSA